MSKVGQPTTSAEKSTIHEVFNKYTEPNRDTTHSASPPLRSRCTTCTANVMCEFQSTDQFHHLILTVYNVSLTFGSLTLELLLTDPLH